ncbi:MAG: TetR/AcrR family transcriptional regulator [Actinobacteria bacterium]|nr:TetR/AcrR family transcriptional regulator [Actinomycetota bacterium]
MEEQPEQTRDRRREKTRRALIEAAAQVFARSGFDGASVDAIAEAAGFTKGAVYSNFDSKEELFFEVVDARLADVLEGFSANVGEDAIAVDLLPAAIDSLSTVYADPDWVLLEVEVLLYAQRHPGARQRLAEFRREQLDRIEGFIEGLLAEGEVRLPRTPREVAALVTAATIGIAHLELADPSGDHHSLYASFLSLLADATR